MVAEGLGVVPEDLRVYEVLDEMVPDDLRVVGIVEGLDVFPDDLGLILEG